MSAPRLYSSREIAAGIALCLAAIALLGFAAYGISTSSIWRKRSELYIVFENVNALRPDAPVRYNGVEVGRVKSMRMLHLDEAVIKERFAVLSKRDVNNLPLWPDSVRKQLLELNDAEFEAACRQALSGRTMIEICLEVLQDNDATRYRLDDQARVVTTIFGDTGVEIISGRGPEYDLGSQKFILGQSGEFFSNLGRSLGEVREILAKVTDAVGTEDRRNFERAQARFEPIQNRARTLGETARDRGIKSAQKFENVSSALDTVANRTTRAMEAIKPELERSAESIQARLEKMNTGLGTLRPELDDAIDMISANATSLRTEFDVIIKPARTDYDAARNIFAETMAQVNRSGWHVSNMRDTAGQALLQSEGELPRILAAAEQSGINLIHFGYSAKYNKDLFISNGDEGEYELNSILDTYRRMALSSRRLRQSKADLDGLAQMLSFVPEKKSRAPMIEMLDDDLWTVRAVADPAAPAAVTWQSSPQTKSILSKTLFTQKRLAQMLRPLDEVMDSLDQKVYPAYERKKAGWAFDAPAEREK